MARSDHEVAPPCPIVIGREAPGARARGDVLQPSGMRPGQQPAPGIGLAAARTGGQLVERPASRSSQSRLGTRSSRRSRSRGPRPAHRVGTLGASHGARRPDRARAGAPGGHGRHRMTPSGNGSAIASATWNVDVPEAGGRDVGPSRHEGRLDRVDAHDRPRRDQAREVERDGARATADIQQPHACLQMRQQIRGGVLGGPPSVRPEDALVMAMDVSGLGPGHRIDASDPAPAVRSAQRGQRDSRQGGSMPIEWDPQAQQWHLHNGRLSVVLAVLESGALGQLYFGAPLDGRPRLPAPCTRTLRGLRATGSVSPSGSSCRRPIRATTACRPSRCATRTARGCSTCAARPTGSRAGKPRAARPAQHVHRGCRRGGHAGDRPRRRDQRPDRHRAADHLPRPCGHRPQHHPPQRRPDGRPRRAPS